MSKRTFPSSPAMPAGQRRREPGARWDRGASSAGGVTAAPTGRAHGLWKLPARFELHQAEETARRGPPSSQVRRGRRGGAAAAPLGESRRGLGRCPAPSDGPGRFKSRPRVAPGVAFTGSDTITRPWAGVHSAAPRGPPHRAPSARSPGQHAPRSPSRRSPLRAPSLPHALAPHPAVPLTGCTGR